MYKYIELQRKETMRLFREHYNSWLVVVYETHEDNEEVLGNYFIFTNDVIYHTSFYDGFQNTISNDDLVRLPKKLKDAAEKLYLFYDKIIDTLHVLEFKNEIERKEKLEKIIEQVKPDYEKYCEMMKERSKNFGYKID